MEKYIIEGEYPNKKIFTATVLVERFTDAFAMAQGLRKVTTLKKVAVVDCTYGEVMLVDEEN